eukprot:TRINITY_DN24121_c0_g1_i1.p1 TRINITY_DN24121_c0_g1~~TRINITY_DN24121_c0_g1_i1.p1  ORF type:complete len:179 (-),score=49.33 TRINITY_DN24121_c0_g1_i1:183-719(-)
MGKGRKILKKEALEPFFEIQDGQTVMQVVSLRGSNIIEVIDSKGFKTLALLPAKFHKSIWIKRGSYVLVEEGDREKALESGNKVTCMILQVLFNDHVRMLQKASCWPEGFHDSNSSPMTRDSVDSTSAKETPSVHPRDKSDEECSSDDGLPPLEENTNRRMYAETYSNSGSESEFDSS